MQECFAVVALPQSREGEAHVAFFPLSLEKIHETLASLHQAGLAGLSRRFSAQNGTKSGFLLIFHKNT